MNDIQIIHMNMPVSIKGLSIRGFDSDYGDVFYTVFINSCTSYDQQKETLLHELDHIRHEDFESCRSVNCLERKRHHEIPTLGDFK